MNTLVQALLRTSILAVMLTVILALGVSACSDDESGGQNNNITPIPGVAIVRLTAVNPAEDRYEIGNYGGETMDISNYRLCSELRYTTNLTSLTIESGSLSLESGQTVTLSGFSINDTGADLGIYEASGEFSSSTAMVDYMQWGKAGNGRESVAVSKGIWTLGDYVSGQGPFVYTGDGNQNGNSYWSIDGSGSSDDDDDDGGGGGFGY